MFLKNISIIQFKSHEQLALELSEGINVFCGKNGIGKTNILDAIYFLLNGKSYFLTSDNLCIKQSENYFLIKGSIEVQNKIENLQVSFQQGKRKNIKTDEKQISKIADYFGKYPCVMIAPDDVEIINGESELRRNFFDYLFSITDRFYLEHLIAYNKALENRNRQLKIFIENNNYDEVLIEFYNKQLEKHGIYIFEVRQNFTPIYKEYFENSYKTISSGNDIARFEYQSNLFVSDFKTGFMQSEAKDRILGRTSFGIHKDDWQFELNSMPLKKTGSQGQIKSFLISLKFASYNLIFEKRKIKPLLLLDDIFEKIDYTRIEKLKEILSQTQTGQVFITDTSKTRVEKIFIGNKNIRNHEL